MSDSMISRKQFLIHATTIAAAGAASLAGVAMADESANEIVTPNGDVVFTGSESWDRETDVLVIGCGAAGSAAALTAHENGVETLIVESAPMAGGCISYGLQGIAAAGTQVQKDLGIEDSPEKYLEYMLEACDGEPDLIKLYVDHHLETYEWMQSIGMTVPSALGTLPGLVFAGNRDIGEPIPRCHFTDSGLWPVLNKALEDNGIEVLTDCPCTNLISNAANGDIVGAVAGGLRIKARKAVIMCCGGFAANPELIRDHVTTKPFRPYTTPFDRGDGIKLAASVGARLAYLNSIMDAPTYDEPALNCPYLVTTIHPITEPAHIAVNIEAHRFIDETCYEASVNRAILQQPGGYIWVIASGQDGKEGFGYGLVDLNGGLPETLIEAETLEELAEKLELDYETLQQTVDAWNASAEAGFDATFGRPEVLKPLEPPYSAMKVMAGSSSTISSVRTDTDLHVLRALDNQPIGRLYAAGANGCTLGRIYPTGGAGRSSAITMGRLAGAAAAALENWE